MSSIDANIILYNKINDDVGLPQITQEEAHRLVSTTKYPITESSNSSKNSTAESVDETEHKNPDMSGSDRSSLLDILIKKYNDSMIKSGKSQVTIGRYQALLKTQNEERKAIGKVPLDRLVTPPPVEVEEKTATMRAAKPKSAPHKKSLTAKYSGHGKGNKAQRVNGLPRGWTVKLVARKGGCRKGRVDKIWFSPDGETFRSKISVNKFLKNLIKKNGNVEGYDPIMFAAAPSATSPQKDRNIEQPKKKKKLYDSEEENQLELNDNDDEYQPAESSVGENCKVSKSDSNVTSDIKSGNIKQSPQKDGNIEQSKKKKKLNDSDEEYQLESNDNDEEYQPSESSDGENYTFSKPRNSQRKPITSPTQKSGSNVTSDIKINSPGLKAKAEGLPKGW
eukprot:CAMPEP_0194269160 /NCGR_PEP_ID=MMETSP0169-20130528/3362_1 /TAXON_ID=218684 /ORGANISM="Corethron pennatum, Strain L29A3" /LENGTH=392 /DNA_ID=CAMNT_0039010691 /DNA_START=175 /DNA_END=1350 /DNA_ORIENTATION=+